ncbi:hypothetical protein Hanom_Chr04g00318441 [Helianthus anomalus]
MGCQAKGKCKIDTDDVLVTKNENLVKGKSKVEENVTGAVNTCQKAKGKCKIDTDDVLVTKNENLVKGKSKVDDARTQRNLRSRVKRVDAALITGSPVLKSTELVEDRIVSFLDIFYCLHSSAILIT